MYVYVHTHTKMYMYICVDACIHVSIYACDCVHVSIYMQACTREHMLHAYRCEYSHVNTCLYSALFCITNLNTIQKWKKINVPTLEKILVDIIADEKLFSAQQGELEFIYKRAFDKYNINESKMKRYASRRNRETEIKNQTNIITAK